ncbi:MAG: hypothetical protein B7Y15_10775 [Bacteroidetes bacterium 24-39-8]|jgi:hypothetical protein|nr:MAG: hypothetical protein B7Y15_10775 [Bacteroidetes bacterium 24-39-8]OZA62661.1 MAG: hypothetical protein B7X72_11550 [Sphingobacteriia bacterium 39-39-8]HQR94810.1 hypothetical protein [Sediminibacterium sp.]HQS55852.1 hypothetical protein [Sediminibacterium sp.]
MKLLLTSLAFLFISSAWGQYYFNDLLATAQSQAQYQLLRSQKVKKIIAISFEEDGSPAEKFLLEQELSMDGKRLSTKSGIQSGKTSTVTSFFELSKLKRTLSNSNGIDNKMEYFYDNAGKLIKLSLTSGDTAVKYSTQEFRDWIYGANGLPESIIKVKNKTDSSIAKLVIDEDGNIAEEQWRRKNTALETYYYYYDPQHRLTDIVRFNQKLKKLVPDYVFEYDAKGRLIQMTQLSGSGKYFTWQYEYNEKGLKWKETCRDNERKLVGKIEYKYEFH